MPPISEKYMGVSWLIMLEAVSPIASVSQIQVMMPPANNIVNTALIWVLNPSSVGFCASFFAAKCSEVAIHTRNTVAAK